jgi:RNA polymerase sigma-70 factor (ECF subfamily)
MSTSEAASFGDDAELKRLLRETGKGSSQATEQLFDRLYPYLLLSARTQLDSDLRAKVRESDLVQQSLMEAHRELPRFDGSSVVDLIDWLEKILKSNVADLRRRLDAGKKHGVEPELSLDDSQSLESHTARQKLYESPSFSDSSILRDQKLDAAIARLPLEYQQVILLHHREKMTFSQIGKLTAKSADAARMLWGRAVKRLQIELGEPDDKPGNEST